MASILTVSLQYNAVLSQNKQKRSVSQNVQLLSSLEQARPLILCYAKENPRTVRICLNTAISISNTDTCISI